MYETKSSLKYCQDIVDEFNKKTNKWEAQVLGFLTKNMSMYTQTIKIRKKEFFGKSFKINYWDSGFFEMRENEDFDLKPFIEPIKLFEKMSGKELRITRTGRI